MVLLANFTIKLLEIATLQCRLNTGCQPCLKGVMLAIWGVRGADTSSSPYGTVLPLPRRGL